MDSHPGGRQIIIKVLGREATEFEDWHTFDILDEVAHLRVGRLVPSMEAKFVEKYEVVIHDWVFDISGLGKDQSNVEKDNFIHEQVAELGGTDLSEAIKKKNDKTAAALAHLFQMKHRIVGRIYREETLREIPDGELKKHDKPNFSTGAWVAVDDHVYNITRASCSLFPSLLLPLALKKEYPANPSCLEPSSNHDPWKDFLRP